MYAAVYHRHVNYDILAYGGNVTKDTIFYHVPQDIQLMPTLLSLRRSKHPQALACALAYVVSG